MAFTVLHGDDADSMIIQRLFSTSMDIHSTLQLVQDASTTNLLREAIDRLDHAINQIRIHAFDGQRP